MEDVDFQNENFKNKYFFLKINVLQKNLAKNGSGCTSSTTSSTLSAAGSLLSGDVDAHRKDLRSPAFLDFEISGKSGFGGFAQVLIWGSPPDADLGVRQVWVLGSLANLDLGVCGKAGDGSLLQLQVLSLPAGLDFGDFDKSGSWGAAASLDLGGSGKFGFRSLQRIRRASPPPLHPHHISSVSRAATRRDMKLHGLSAAHVFRSMRFTKDLVCGARWSGRYKTKLT